jgi:plasmid stabilization system protein ParE
VRYLLTPEAEAELAEAVSFYAANVSLSVARNFLAKFEEKALLLTEFPGIGTPTTRGRQLFPIGRYPYSILYCVHDGAVRVSAIAAHARRPLYWRKRQP